MAAVQWNIRVASSLCYISPPLGSAPHITHITLPWVINWITSLHYSWSRRASKPFDSFRIHDGRHHDNAYGGSEIPTWPIWYPRRPCVSLPFSHLLSRLRHPVLSPPSAAILLSTTDRPYVTYFTLERNMKKNEGYRAILRIEFLFINVKR